MTKLDPNEKLFFLQGKARNLVLAINIVMAALYFAVITFFFEHGNPVLFALLIMGEVFHLWQIFGFCYTVWGQAKPAAFDAHFAQPVDVFVTVAGEPAEIVAATVKAAIEMDYPSHKVYVLNDGFVAKKDNWQEIEQVAHSLGAVPITRRIPGGAKAGNINNALRETASPYVVIFDADHVPHKDFLKKVMGYFTDEKMGFVQTPQFYHNANLNQIARAAWDQQTLFFGAIMTGKNRTGSAFMCGTNMAFSRAAIDEAGGMCEFNIAEDFLTSLFIHEKGWKSWYVPEVLAEGLAPEDFLTYYKQQFRWTRGSLEVIFKYNPLLRRGLSWPQKIQYLVSASYYLSGIVVLVDALLPVIFLYTGITAIVTSTMTLAFIFIPYIFLNLYVLQKTSGFTYTFGAIGFSLSSFYLQVHAVIAVLLGQKTSFAITSKTAVQGNFLRMVLPQIAYVVAVLGGIVVGAMREGLSASLLSNTAWALVNTIAFAPFIYAAMPRTAVLRIRRMLGLTKKHHKKALHQPGATALAREGGIS
jgi:cellulose synthase (UDP-forming)